MTSLFVYSQVLRIFLSVIFEYCKAWLTIHKVCHSCNLLCQKWLKHLEFPNQETTISNVWTFWHSYTQVNSQLSWFASWFAWQRGSVYQSELCKNKGTYVCTSNINDSTKLSPFHVVVYFVSKICMHLTKVRTRLWWYLWRLFLEISEYLLSPQVNWSSIT